jgi:hypothetical protein
VIEFNRYPHVGTIIEHYAKELNNNQMLDLLKTEISSEDGAFMYGRFILTMVDHIARDMQNDVSVLGSKDNTSMIPDIDYEVSLYLANRGFEEVWDNVCDEG